MQKEDALSILNSRKTISQEGKYEAKVTNVTSYFRAFDKGPSQIAIANFNVMTPHHTEQAVNLFKQGLYAEAVNHTLSSSLREGDYIPSKGETVNITVSLVTTKNNVTGLFVTSVTPIPAKKASPFNVDLLLEEEEEGTNILREDLESPEDEEINQKLFGEDKTKIKKPF